MYKTKQIRKKAGRAFGQIVLLAEPFRSISFHVVLPIGTIVKDLEMGQKFLGVLLMGSMPCLRICPGLSDCKGAYAFYHLIIL